MLLDILQVHRHVGTIKLNLLIKKRPLLSITHKGTVSLVTFSRIFCVVRGKDMYSRSHDITVCIKNAYGICVGKMVWKKGG